MSISYDTMSAYMERESNRLAEEDRAVQKQIADDAIAKVMGAQNQINTNIGNAVETAYRQNDRTAKGLNAETSQIGNQALTERLVRGLNTNKNQINTTLDNLKLGIQANNEQNLADVDTNYGIPQAERELEIRLAQQEQDKALKEAQETAKEQEGFLEQLNEISRQAGYNYDFDADIFALKQQGYTNSDWQIQYLKEAKRLQTLNKSKSKSSGKSSRSSASSGATTTQAPSVQNSSQETKPAADLNEYRQYLLSGRDTIVPTPLTIANEDATPEQVKAANNLSASFGVFSSQEAAVNAIENAVLYKSITEAQARALLLQLGYKED